jgi:hypothetical protein
LFVCLFVCFFFFAFCFLSGTSSSSRAGNRLNSRTLGANATDVSTEGAYDYCGVDGRPNNKDEPIINFTKDRPSNDGANNNVVHHHHATPQSALTAFDSSHPNAGPVNGIPVMATLPLVPSLSLSYPSDTYHIPSSPRIATRQSMSSGANVVYQNATSPRLVPLKRIPTEREREREGTSGVACGFFGFVFFFGFFFFALVSFFSPIR